MSEADASNLSKTLTELEGAWPEQPGEKSHLVTTCHALRRKPLGEFTVEDLRIMIGQDVGLKFLVPLAMERLEEDPLAEGDYYPGDLLRNVLSLDRDFWRTHTDLRGRVAQVGERARKLIEESKEGPAVRQMLADAFRTFQAASG